MSTQSRTTIRREADLMILSDWIEPGSRVLDLGCGRGILLEHLQTAKNSAVVGVDTDYRKILGCVKRRVPAYHGDITAILPIFPDRYFDWVVCSRTLQELEKPIDVMAEALRVGKRVAVGFVNYGFWSNRLSMLWRGSRVQNEVYPEPWYTSRPSNPITVRAFEEFCTTHGATINRVVYLGADWRTPCRLFPSLRSGYALYEISKTKSPWDNLPPAPQQA